MNVFTQAVADIFADANFTEAGSYEPQGGGAAVAVTVVRHREVTQSAGGVAAVVGAPEIAQVRFAELAGVDVRRGDRLVLGGAAYWIDNPFADADGQVWRFDLARAD